MKATFHSEFISLLARPQPDPGGGSAAAYACKTAAALVMKVAQLERSRILPEQFETSGMIIDTIHTMMARFDALISEDMEAYAEFMRARNQRGSVVLANAVRKIMDCPLDIIRSAQVGLSITEQLAAYCRNYLAADLFVAAEIFGGAARGAYWIALSNQQFEPLQLYTERIDQVFHELELHYDSCKSVLSDRLQEVSR